MIASFSSLGIDIPTQATYEHLGGFNNLQEVPLEGIRAFTVPALRNRGWSLKQAKKMFRDVERNIFKIPGIKGQAVFREVSPGEMIGLTWYLRTGDEQTDLFLQGHEETHALHYLGGLPALESRLAEKGKPISFRETYSILHASDEQCEIIAHIGGLYALERKGIALSQVVPRILPWKARFFEDALQQYRAT